MNLVLLLMCLMSRTTRSISFETHSIVVKEGSILDVKPVAAVSILNDEDEDVLSAGMEWGHAFLRHEINQHIEAVVARLANLQGDVTGPSEKDITIKRYPIFKLLDYTKRIMQTTCQAVTPDFFELAFNSFVTLQTETFHFIEPYLKYDTFYRIELALQRCLETSSPYMFSRNVTVNLSSYETCDNWMPSETSNVSVNYFGDYAQEEAFSLPVYVDSRLNQSISLYAEPLIETVWKMVLNAHSHCFFSFDKHYNDHHTFTVAAVQLFVNQIQELWLQGYHLDNTREHKLYGGLLGNVKKIMGDVDNCVGAASRQLFPWFMTRPRYDKESVLLDVNITPKPVKVKPIKNETIIAGKLPDVKQGRIFIPQTPLTLTPRKAGGKKKKFAKT